MPETPRFALFPTAIGECGLAWSGHGVCAAWLPQTGAPTLPARIARRWPQAARTEPGDETRAVIVSLRRLLDGEAVDLTGVRLDLESVPDFARQVYAVARAIPAGSVLTYGAVAARIGAGATAQAVGQALAANPVPLLVPCHRVIAAHGRLGGFSAPGGTATKRRLLAIENARADGRPDLFT